MCLGIPMKVLDSRAFELLCRDRDGSDVWIDARLTGVLPPGTWVMTFAGAARDVMEEQAAHQCLDALSALQALMAGEQPDLDALFADLVNRDPQLPDFLRPSPKKDSL